MVLQSPFGVASASLSSILNFLLFNFFAFSPNNGFKLVSIYKYIYVYVNLTNEPYTVEVGECMFVDWYSGITSLCF